MTSTERAKPDPLEYCNPSMYSGKCMKSIPVIALYSFKVPRVIGRWGQGSFLRSRRNDGGRSTYEDVELKIGVLNMHFESSIFSKGESCFSQEEFSGY